MGALLATVLLSGESHDHHLHYFVGKRRNDTLVSLESLINWMIFWPIGLCEVIDHLHYNIFRSQLPQRVSQCISDNIWKNEKTKQHKPPPLKSLWFGSLWAFLWFGSLWTFLCGCDLQNETWNGSTAKSCKIPNHNIPTCCLLIVKVMEFGLNLGWVVQGQSKSFPLVLLSPGQGGIIILMGWRRRQKMLVDTPVAAVSSVFRHEVKVLWPQSRFLWAKAGVFFPVTHSCQ